MPSTMVTTPSLGSGPLSSTQPTGFERVRVKVSPSSSIPSAIRGTATWRSVTPGANTSEPATSR